MRKIPEVTLWVRTFIGEVKEKVSPDGGCTLTLVLFLEGMDGVSQEVSFPITREKLEEWKRPFREENLDYRFLPMVLSIHRPELEVEE